MANPSANFAVTKDGGIYNKLQRPDNYPVMTSQPPLGKRKREQSATPESKRTRAGVIFKRTNIGATDKGCGMRTGLPGGSEDEQLSDDSTNEALAYIRSVRSEASLIPSTLVAPTWDGYNESEIQAPHLDASDTRRSVYKDGTRFALDDNYEDIYSEDVSDEDYCNADPQDGCYKLLLVRLQSLRQQITKVGTNSSNSISPTVSEKNPSFTQIPRTQRAWLQTIGRGYPALAQIVRMSERDAFFGLQSCATSFREATTISHEKCCWIWSLLALAGDVGTLNYEQVSKIRNLGLEAGRLGVRLRETFRSRLDNGNNHAGADDSADEEEDPARHDRAGAIGGFEDSKYDMATDSLLEADVEDAGRTCPSSPKVGGDMQRGGLLKGETSESGAEMSMSENEEQSHNKADTKDLEEARARLLAQLGDRLVQPRVPSSRVEAERQRQQTETRKGTVQHVQTQDGVSHHPAAEGSALADGDWDTTVAVDMILTVAAECYGQKDLLRFRAAW